MDKKNKLFIFEFDGGSWNVIDPLLSKGKLPNLKRLMERGSYGTLESDEPLVSPRLWTTIYTGKHPSVHGAEFFVPSSMVKQKRLWDIFSDKGLKVGVFGSLVTWPPYPVNGFMIPSIFDIGTETYPSEYQIFQEIALGERGAVQKTKGNKSLMDYFATFFKMQSNLRNIGVTFNTFGSFLRYLVSERALSYNLRDKYWRKSSLYLKMSVDVFLHLYHHYNPNFVTFHNHYCDSVSHRYWDCFEPQHFNDVSSKDIKRYKDVVPNAYIYSDNVLGKILSQLDPSTTVLIVSDHGMNAQPASVKTYNMKLENFVRILGVQDWVIPGRFGRKCFLFYTKVDNLQKKSLADTLRFISFVDTGEKLFDLELKDRYVRLNPTERLQGMDKHDIPQDLAIQIDENRTCHFSEIFVRQNLDSFDTHYKDGIFIAAGPEIKKAEKLKLASIYDIAPTALKIMGFPVAKDMEGRVLTEILNEDASVNSSNEIIDTYEDVSISDESPDDYDVEKVKDRLRLLGYL